MSKLVNLVVLYGGKSGEHEISLISAASVLAKLNANKYHIIPIGMDKDGRIYLNDYQEMLEYPKSLPVVAKRSQLLPSLLVNGRFAVDADVVFPVVHGPMYEDGCLQGLLELADVAYVGCDVLSSAIGMDKDMARQLVCRESIQSARYKALSYFASPAQRQQFCQEAATELGWPLFVKPCSLGSSVGIHKVTSMASLTQALDDAFRYDETVLVEEFIQGREIELAVLEHPALFDAPLVSLPGEIKVHHSDGFYSYVAKYLESDATELTIPAVLESNLVTRLQKMAVEIFLRLKCKGLARVDFFVDDCNGEIYFNEINTLPGFTSISMYPKMWQASGLEYPELLDNLIALALKHYAAKQKLMTSYQ